MGYTINGTKIILVRGDSLNATININDSDGSKYIPKPLDSIRFAMKKTYDEISPRLVKYVDTDTMVLSIAPEDTKELEFGEYVYDIQITMEDGTVDTFIKGKLKLTEEVD